MDQGQTGVDLSQRLGAVAGGLAVGGDVALVGGGAAVLGNGVGAQGDFSIARCAQLAHQVAVGVGNEGAAVGQAVEGQVVRTAEFELVYLAGECVLLLGGERSALGLKIGGVAVGVGGRAWGGGYIGQAGACVAGGVGGV